MDPLPISALEHFVYCPRQCALICADGEWVDTTHTIRGARGHRRADERAGRIERGRRVLRGEPLWSERWGLSGRADAIEILSSGQIVPVEYKIGRRHGDAADVQLCAQALCLEEMLSTRIAAGALWYSGPRRRIPVAFDAALRKRTEDVIHSVRAIVESGCLPGAPNDARCRACQLVERCLPEVVSHLGRLADYLSDEVFACG